MAAYYRQRPVSKYVVHPHYADEQEAQIDYQVRERVGSKLKCDCCTFGAYHIKQYFMFYE